MKVIFLDFDGVLNSKQEVIYHRRKRKNRFLGNLRSRIETFLFWQVTNKIWNVLPDNMKTISSKIVRYYFRNECDFCPIACSNLQYILDKAPTTKIVISSSWRIWNLWWCKKILERNGIDPSRVIDVTPRFGALKDEDGFRFGATQRGHQIRAWLNKHKKVKKFVVLDDNSDMATVEDHFIKIDPHVGLTIRDSYLAISMLGHKIEYDTLFDA